MTAKIMYRHQCRIHINEHIWPTNACLKFALSAIRKSGRILLPCFFNASAAIFLSPRVLYKWTMYNMKVQFRYTFQMLLLIGKGVWQRMRRIRLTFWNKKDSVRILFRSWCVGTKKWNAFQKRRRYVKQYYCVLYHLKPMRCCGKTLFFHCLLESHFPGRWKIVNVGQDFKKNSLIYSN